MAEAGAWGAWQAKPGKFTQLVADSMKKLYVATHLPTNSRFTDMLV